MGHQMDKYALQESQKEKRAKGANKIFEDIVAENIPDLMEDMNINIKEIQQF